MLYILAALLGSGAFALSAHFKHSAASSSGGSEKFGDAVRSVRRTVLRPLWLAGLAADLLGVGLQIVALKLGPLAVVQPLMICSLLFAVMLRQRTWSPRVVGWAFAIVAGLSIFALVARVRPTPGTPVDGAVAATMGMCGVLLFAVALAAANRLTLRARATVLAVVVGMIYAVTAALLKALTTLVSHGVVGVLASWQLYALIVLALVGVVLTQVAFASGPITGSLPLIAVVDPIVSVGIGVWVFDERIHGGPLATVLLILTAALVGIGVRKLGVAGSSALAERTATTSAVHDPTLRSRPCRPRRVGATS